MDDTGTTKRKARPDEAPNIKSFTIEQDYHLRLAQLSAGGSVSAVIREIIELYQDEGIQLLVKEPLIRTSVWVPPEMWDAFRTKTEEDGITMADVIRAGIVKLEKTHAHAV